MAIQHKHGATYSNQKLLTSAGEVKLDANGCVVNGDEVDVDKLLAGGQFVDTDMEPGEYGGDDEDSVGANDDDDTDDDTDDEDDDGDEIIDPPKYGTKTIEILRKDAEKWGFELPSKTKKADIISQLERCDELSELDDEALAKLAEENELEVADDATREDIIVGIVEAENE